MDYTNYTRQRAAELGLDPNLAHALMLAESSGNPNAVSPVGATGLLQLMPDTARQLGVDPRNPYQNIDGGLRYLKQNIDKYGIAGGLAAYNAGPGRVQKTDNFNQLPAETRNYVPKVMNMAADIAEKQQGTAPKTLDIPTLMSGLEKAKAAQDADSVKEINGLLMQKYQGALQKAQAANDAEAVQEITNAMKQFGPEMQPAPDTPMARGRPTMQNDPRIVDPNAPAPKGVKAPEQPSMAAKAFQTVDDYVRAAANGLTFGWADRLAAAGDAALGKGDYKTNVKQERAQSEAAHQRNPYGYKATEIGSGLLLPGGVALKGLEKAAPVVGNTLAGAAYGALSGSGAESGDTNLGQAVANTATGAAIGAPTGAVLTPLIGKAAEGLSSAVPWIDQKLTKGYIAKTFQDSLTAKVDAEITRDIGLLKNGTDKTIKPQTMNDLQGRYVDEAKTLAKKAGLLDDDVANLTVDRYRSMLADPAKLQQLQSTPAGRALVDNLQKANRTYELTQAIEANNGMIPKLARTAVDSGLLDAGIMSATGLPVPIASAARAGIKKALGGNETRTEVINQVGSPRALKAADQFLAENGPSDATKGLGVLRQAAESKGAQEAADAGALREANIAGMRLNRAPAGGAFQTLKQYTGMPDEEIVQSLRILSNHPVLGKYADQIRAGGNTDNGALFAVQNAINGLQKRGVLNSTPVSNGALSQATTETPNIANFVRGLNDDQLKAIVGRESDTVGKGIKSMKGYAVGKLSKIVDDIQAGKTVPDADRQLVESLGLLGGTPARIELRGMAN